MREEILQRVMMTRRRITRSRRMNQVREKIIDQIFLRLGKRQVIKMKEIFNVVVPVLVDIIKVRRCALFAVMENGEQVVLEAGYPETEHGIGEIFSVNEPYINAVVNPNVSLGDFEDHSICYNYVLIKNPLRSDLIPPALKHFLESKAIYSVLFVPLRVSGGVKYFLTFDSNDQHESFSKEEIDILTFFGKELMKGLGLEKMGDMLHDLRNPAIAAAAFSRKVKTALQQGRFPSESEAINRWLDIVIEETSRIEDLAFTLRPEGRKEIIDLTNRLSRRFLVNAGLLQGLGRANVRLVQPESATRLPVLCSPLQIDRVLDNLLGNATNAVPEEGGEISVRSYQEESWGVVEIMNTGRISAEDQKLLLDGDGRGRGLHITTRLIKRMDGRLDVEVDESQTTFRLLLPIADESGTKKIMSASFENQRR